MKVIRVNLKKSEDRSYKIIIGVDILKDIGNAIKNLGLGNNIFIISDSKVGKLYGEIVVNSCISAGFHGVGKIYIPEGEESKSIQWYSKILESIHKFDKYQDKKIVIVAVGGGVVGDIGGFVAGTYRRGVKYIQVPTTLLSQVDSSIGGKTGINFTDAKNSVGVFWQPSLVYVDLSALRTLNLRELKSGLAEVIKYGVIMNRKLFEYLEKNMEKILSYELNTFKYIVPESVKIKARITELDERDTKDIRAILNFGHTIGHAVEAATKYKVYTHGEAVAVGMLCAGDIAHQLGMFEHSELGRLNDVVARAGLPCKIKCCSINSIMHSMRYDKKFVSGKNKFILPVAIGKVKVVTGVDEKIIRQVIQKRMM